MNDGISKNLNINSNVETETFFLNVYADFSVAKKLELYAGAGVGMAKHSSKTDWNLKADAFGSNTNPPISYSDTASNTCVAYNVQAGAAYLITDNVAIDLGLRYADLGEVELGGLLSLEADKMISKEVVLALRYTF